MSSLSIGNRWEWREQNRRDPRELQHPLQGVFRGGGCRRRGTGSSPAGLVGVFVFAVSL